MQCKDIYNFLEKHPDQNKYQQSAFSASAGESFGGLYQQKKKRDFKFFVDQATPGFELGKKGFAVLCLTTRPCRQNATNTK